MQNQVAPSLDQPGMSADILHPTFGEEAPSMAMSYYLVEFQLPSLRPFYSELVMDGTRGLGQIQE